jgi:DNA-directed RNA polymerase specialized sigma24 family protein
MAVNAMANSLRADHFDALIERLGPNREDAGERYLHLRRRLASFFGYRHCAHPEEDVDETLDRVARKLLEEGSAIKNQDLMGFVFGVARNVAHESIKRREPAPLPANWDIPSPNAPEYDDQHNLQADCLTRCLQRLPEVEGGLIIRYFEREGRQRIRGRAALARELGVTSNALALKVSRLKRRLSECIFQCVEMKGLIGLVKPANGH